MFKFIKNKLGIIFLENQLIEHKKLIQQLNAENVRLRKIFSNKFESNFDMHLKSNSRLILLTSIRGGSAYTVDFNTSRNGFQEIRELLLSIFGREWPELQIIDAPPFIEREIRHKYSNRII